MARGKADIKTRLKRQEEKILKMSEQLEKEKETYKQLQEEERREAVKKITEAFLKSKRSVDEVLDFNLVIPKGTQIETKDGLFISLFFIYISASAIQKHNLSIKTALEISFFCSDICKVSSICNADFAFFVSPN